MDGRLFKRAILPRKLNKVVLLGKTEKPGRAEKRSAFRRMAFA